MPVPSTPPAPRPSRFRRGLRIFARRGTGHAFGVLHNIFNLALLTLIVLFGALLLRDDLPVPDFIRDRLEQEFTARGFTLAFEHAQIDPTARIVAERVTLAPHRFGGAIVAAGRVVVELDRLKLVAGRVEFVALDAEELRILCPPSLSPSGEAVPLLEIASLRLQHHAGVWRVPGMVAAIGPVEVIARGMFNASAAPLDPATKPLPDLDHLLDEFARLAPEVVRGLAQLTPLQEPRLDVTFRGALDEPITIDVNVKVAGIRDERVGELRGLQARTHVTLRGDPTTAPVRLTARVEHFKRVDVVQAESIELNAEWLAFPTRENFLPWQVNVAAGRVLHEKGTVNAPVLAIYPLAYPLVELTAGMVLEGEPITIAAEADVRARSAEVDVHGGAGRTWLQRASEILGRDVTYYATITTPPDVSAHATIAPDLQFVGADFRVVTPPMIARKVPLDRARVRGHVSRQGMRIDHLEFSRGDESGSGSYQSDFRDRDYRFRLTGSVRPPGISGWFGPWWERFWRDYEFRGPPPVFDLDAHGNWLRPEPILMTGSGRATNVAIRGIPCDAVDTRLFVRPNYFDLFDATIRRPEGRLDGSVSLRFERGNPVPLWQQFAFSSNADLVELARIFGAGGEEWLAPYRYTVPPNVTVIGAVTRQEKDYDVRLDIGLNTGEEFRYLDFPFSWLTTRIVVKNRHVTLPEIYAGYAQGVLTGNAVVDAGQLTFDAKLVDSDFDLATKIYSDYVDRNFPTPPEPDEANSMVREDYGGELSLALAATGPVADLKAFNGKGELELTDSKLYQLKVIGIFSDMFGSGLGTFGFTDAKGAFDVRRDRVIFPNLRVTGRTARLDANGAYSLADGNIDFRVRLEALRESSGFITKLLGVVVNPLTNLLFEARLTGTLRNPKRNVEFLAPRAPVEAEPVPESQIETPAESAESAAATR